MLFLLTHILVVSKEDEVEIMGDEEVAMEDKELEFILNSSSIIGLDSLKTMKFVENIRGQRMVIFFYSEATHNFISQ